MALAGTPVADALDSARIALTASGADSPRLDAEILLADVMGVQRARLMMEPERELDRRCVRAFQTAVHRRAIDREPVAYIIGRRGFRHLELHVDPRVLIPRPETELLVEVALELRPGGRVLDVGTGSGAVALAVKHERPDLEVTGSDLSPGALVVAGANASRLDLAVTWVHADLLEHPRLSETRWDAVLANPPYVAEAEREALAPEITRHEPRESVFAGSDGLAVLRRLAAQAGASRPGLLAVEVGAGQAPAVSELMVGAGLCRVHTRRDLAGVERVVVGQP